MQEPPMQPHVNAAGSSRPITTIECTVIPGTGIGPHRNEDYDQMLYVLEGEVVFLLHDRLELVSPGGSIYVPPGTLHAWKNETRTNARVLLISRDEKMAKCFEDWPLELNLPKAETPSDSFRRCDIMPPPQARRLADVPWQNNAQAFPDPSFLRDGIRVWRSQGSPALQVFGIEVEIILAGKETFHTQCVYQLKVPVGVSMPLYLNRKARQSFYVTAGEFEVLSNGQTLYLQAGDFFTVAPGAEHSFRNTGSSTGLIFGQSVPGGHEEFFRAIDLLLRNNPSPERIAQIFQDHGMRLIRI
jgi:quercetin dioxygenase-like cupin family protein